VRDEPEQVTAVIRSGCAAPSVEVFILTGGTGITKRDSTFEAVEAMLDKRLTGFGELFRMLSYQEIGPAAMLSRARAVSSRGASSFPCRARPMPAGLPSNRSSFPSWATSSARSIDRGVPGRLLYFKESLGTLPG